MKIFHPSLQIKWRSGILTTITLRVPAENKVEASDKLRDLLQDLLNSRYESDFAEAEVAEVQDQ